MTDLLTDLKALRDEIRLAQGECRNEPKTNGYGGGYVAGSLHGFGYSEIRITALIDKHKEALDE